MMNTNEMSNKILMGMAPRNHVALALDEFEGLSSIGFNCKTVAYGSNAGKTNGIIRLFQVVINAFRLARALRHFRPEILYLNSRFEPVGSLRDFISIFIVRMLYHRPLAIAIKSHGSDLRVFDKSLVYRDIIIPYLIKNVNRWFFLSNEEYLEILGKSKLMAGKVTVTSNIIDPKRSLSSPDFKLLYNISPDKFLYLFVGRMVREKGIFTILQSISQLPFKEQCEFIFIGSGNDLEEAKLLAAELEITDVVKFLGFIPEETCDKFYSIGDALVYPTCDSEGFAMALFKSVASGMPVITTQIRAAKDHLATDKNVLWVVGGSIRDLTDAMSRLFYDTELRANMRENNKLLGLNFSQDIVCSQMKTAFLSSLESQHA